MNTLTETLTAIKARAQKATPGPWNNDTDPLDVDSAEIQIAVDVGYEADASFIAAARTDVPALIRALEKAIEQRNNAFKEMGFNPLQCEQLSATGNSKINAILNGGGAV